MKSTHTWQSTPAKTLIERGATIERVKGDLFQIEWPAKGDVGPIGWTAYAEPGDEEALAGFYSSDEK